MSRAHVDYTVRRTLAAPVAGFNPDVPIEGFYTMKLRAGAVRAGIHIWFGPPLDPIDGTELDRAPRWQATANGAPISLEWVWPKCADSPDEASEVAHRIATQEWAKQHAPNSALADPKRRIDLLTEPLPEW